MPPFPVPAGLLLLVCAGEAVGVVGVAEGDSECDVGGGESWEWGGDGTWIDEDGLDIRSSVVPSRVSRLTGRLGNIRRPININLLRLINKMRE